VEESIRDMVERAARGDIDDDWDDFQVTIESIEAVDDETAVLGARLSGRAKASGVPLDRRLGQVWRWRDGLILRVVAYPSPAAARAAAGLPT
jgi:ketosteroid isomerase-like protein